MVCVTKRFPLLALTFLLGALALALVAAPCCLQQAAPSSPTFSPSPTPALPPTTHSSSNSTATPSPTPTAGPSSCTAGFFAQPTVLEGPTSVQFTDQSTGSIASWAWDFGDGSPVSTERNPRHDYNKNGNWSVTLTVQGPGCEDNMTREGYIQVSKCKT